MAENHDTGLRPTLGYWALTCYGLGDILGAGIYALMGKVAGAAGAHAWLGFSVSLLAAAVTALTYSELVTRYPKSGGEAFYTEQGFRTPLVSTVIGWLVFCAGTLSLSAIAVVFAGYLGDWLPGLPTWFVTAAFILTLGAINFWGIRQSSVANIVCTIIEASGLVLVIVVGGHFLATTSQPPTPDTPSPLALGAADWTGVMQGAALAFFAFIGFQDMVNVAEEVHEPRRNFPAAILTALGIAGITYIVIAIIATSVVDPAVLGESEAPLTDVVAVATGDGAVLEVFPVIALFAVANTGLLNFIMASRLLYGMAGQGLVPAPLAAVHRRRRTPHWAILTVLLAALALALSGTLSYLAGSTSTLLLVVFLTVNLALVMVKRRDPDPGGDGLRVPVVVPLLGVAITGAVIGFAEPSVLLTTAGLGAAGAGLWGIRRYSTAGTG